MTLTKTIILHIFLLLSFHSLAELVPVNESMLANVSGQAGITLDRSVDLTIENISYQQRPTESYFIAHDITARYSYIGSTIDVTAQGSLRFGLPETLHIEEFGFSLYNSKTVGVDVNNLDDIQTYTIYADTFGNGYDGFTLNISGTTLDNGSTTFNSSYVNSGTLEGNMHTELTIEEATDISISLTSDNTCTAWPFCDSEEDFAHIVIVDEDGNIVTESGQAGTHNTSLNHSFESPINHNFLMSARLTGTFKMGGAIEMFGAGAVPFKR